MADDVAHKNLECRTENRVRRVRASSSPTSTIAAVENTGACAVSSQRTLWQIAKQAKTVLLEDDDKLACAIYSVFSQMSLPIERVNDTGPLRRLRHGRRLYNFQSACRQ